MAEPEGIFEGFAPGWETMMVAAMNRDHEIRSIVRHNKILSWLQRQGFPICIRFNNLPMGPASAKVETRANKAVEQGYLIPLQYDKGADLEARRDWRLTEEGDKYVREVILPTIKEHEKGKRWLEIFSSAYKAVQYQPNQLLIDESHQALLLDDPDEFAQACLDASERISIWSDVFNKEWTPRSKAELTAAACVELACLAFTSVMKDLNNYEFTSTGKHHILWNARRLLALLEDFDEGGHLIKTGARELNLELTRVLDALEVNGLTYELFELPSEEELGALFEEADEFDPDLMTS